MSVDAPSGLPVETVRLQIRPLLASDATVLGKLNLRLVGENVVSWVETQRRHQARHGFSFWHVAECQSNRPVGFCGLKHRGIEGVSLGYEIASRHRGRGHATEAAAAVLGWARTHVDDDIFASIRPPNPASVRVLEKIGMQLVETQHDSDGERHIYRPGR